jgi:hypothetical protein
MEEDRLHDVIVVLDIMLSVRSKTHEEAYDRVEEYTPEEILTLALEQLPENPYEGFVRGTPTIN